MNYIQIDIKNTYIIYYINKAKMATEMQKQTNVQTIRFKWNNQLVQDTRVMPDGSFIVYVQKDKVDEFMNLSTKLQVVPREFVVHCSAENEKGLEAMFKSVNMSLKHFFVNVTNGINNRYVCDVTVDTEEQYRTLLDATTEDDTRVVPFRQQYVQRPNQNRESGGYVNSSRGGTRGSHGSFRGNSSRGSFRGRGRSNEANKQ